MKNGDPLDPVAAYLLAHGFAAKTGDNEPAANEEPRDDDAPHGPEVDVSF